MSQSPGFPPPPAAPPPMPPSGPFGQPTTRCGMALAALILGILGVFVPLCFLSVIALILGIMALNRIGKSEGRVTGSGMATGGIALSIVGMVVSMVALLVVLLLPALGRARMHANVSRNATLQKQLVTSLVSYADINKGRFPGFGQPNDDPENDQFTNIVYQDGSGTVVEGCNVEARYYELLSRNYFTGEVAISPFENKAYWTTGAVDTTNYSYSMLHIGEDDQYPAKRAVEWKNTINPQAALLSDRNVARNTFKPTVQSVITGTPGEWMGNVGFGDGHVETHHEPVIHTKYGPAEITAFPHAEFIQTGDYLFDAGETDDDGQPVGDQAKGSGAYMIYEGTGL